MKEKAKEADLKRKLEEENSKPLIVKFFPLFFINF